MPTYKKSLADELLDKIVLATKELPDFEYCDVLEEIAEQLRTMVETKMKLSSSSIQRPAIGNSHSFATQAG